MLAPGFAGRALQRLFKRQHHLVNIFMPICQIFLKTGFKKRTKPLGKLP